MAERFLSTGSFWLPAKPDEKVAGELRFDDETGGSLRLIGAFGGMSAFASAFNDDEDKAFDRIHGVAGKRWLTLIDCFLTERALDMPGGVRQTFNVGRVIVGAFFEADEPIVCTSAAVEIEAAHLWVGRTGIELTLQSPTPEGAPDKIIIDYTHPESTLVETAFGSLELGYTYSLGGDHRTEARLQMGSYFDLKFATPATVDDEALMLTGALQDLVTIAADRPSYITDVRLAHPDLVVKLPDGRTRADRFELLMQHRHASTRPVRPVQAHELLFTYADLGGLAGVAQWLDVAVTCRPALARLMSTRYRSSYMESRFLDLIGAAETLHRLILPNELRPRAEYKSLKRHIVKHVPRRWRQWLHQQLEHSNEPRLRKRLEDLVDAAGPAGSLLIPDAKAWAKRVADNRNELTHHGLAGKDGPDGKALYFLGESSYYLVTICLLRRAGADDGVLSKLAKKDRPAWATSNLVQMLAE